jgi:hypothetical protein
MTDNFDWMYEAIYEPSHLTSVSLSYGDSSCDWGIDRGGEDLWVSHSLTLVWKT